MNNQTPDDIFVARFNSGQTLRSAPFREGFLAGAQRAAAGKPGTGTPPYPAGTAHADAWWAGAEEGKARYEWVMRKTKHIKTGNTTA